MTAHQHAEQPQPALAPDVERDDDRERKQRDPRVSGRNRTVLLMQEPEGGDANGGADQKDDEARGFRWDDIRSRSHTAANTNSDKPATTVMPQNSGMPPILMANKPGAR